MWRQLYSATTKLLQDRCKKLCEVLFRGRNATNPLVQDRLRQIIFHR